MTTVTSIARPEQKKRREDFPVESFRYLEAKLQEIRKIVMNRAAQIAGDADSNPQVYRVEKRYVDKALVQFLEDRVSAFEQLGLRDDELT